MDKTKMKNSYKVPAIHGCPAPARIQELIDRIEPEGIAKRVDWVDELGFSMRTPRVLDANGLETTERLLPDRYAELWWDFLRGRIALSENGQKVFRMVPDPTLRNLRTDRWRCMESIESEKFYGIKSTETIPGMLDLLRVMLRDDLDRPRVQHGIKFNGRAFLRQYDGPDDVRGHIVSVYPGNPRYAAPFELSFDVAWSDDIAALGGRLLDAMAEDEDSAANLKRMLATPLLEPYKHLSFVLYGAGGNGKGRLKDALEHDPATGDLMACVDAARLLTGGGGFDGGQAAAGLPGALWAVDEDADDLTEKQLTIFKKVSTGDSLYTRDIGRNATTFHVTSTFILMTNNGVIVPSTPAVQRRMVVVRTKNGRSNSELDELTRCINEHGVAPFMMASCVLWESEGDEPRTGIAVGDGRDLSDFEAAVVDGICRAGYADPTEFMPAQQPANAREKRAALLHLGCETQPRRVGADRRMKRVIVVADKVKFEPFQQAHDADLMTAEDIAAGVTDATTLVDDLRTLDPGQAGFTVDQLAEAEGWDRERVMAAIEAAGGQLTTVEGGRIAAARR